MDPIFGKVKELMLVNDKNVQVFSELDFLGHSQTFEQKVIHLDSGASKTLEHEFELSDMKEFEKIAELPMAGGLIWQRKRAEPSRRRD